ncbi:MAG: hypothetical protein O6940_05860, partial [Ignavibacteria bacterium]|nr:hypothetical protein [Ignavibacteria bacterium]
AEMWFELSEKIHNFEIEYPKDLELRRQLSSVHYEIMDSNGKIKLVGKDKTKKLIGRSPDRADAFVYGMHAIDKVEREKKIINHRKQRMNRIYVDAHNKTFGNRWI